MTIQYQPIKTRQGPKNMAAFVLVHGDFQGGWVWPDLAAELRAMGHAVHTPTLSGCGHLHHGMRKGIDLNTYIRDIGNYLHFEEIASPILVAHSFAGMICSAVIMQLPHLLRHVIYVDGIIPESNRSVVETAGDAFRIMLNAHRENDWMVAPWPIESFGIREDKANWFAARLCSFPLQAFITPFPGEFDLPAVRASFITCRNTASPFIRQMADKAAGLGWGVTESEAGHSPMVSHPSILASLIVDQAG
ncbi:MAG: alpha/beta hydrolase family protein [Desulfobacteraceae bacterium]|nr:alpha/beta hydrolase family protein [Desulfobacteraceae bacterium]